MRLRESRSLRLRDQLRVMLCETKGERPAAVDDTQTLTHASHFSCCESESLSQSCSAMAPDSMHSQASSR